MKKLFFAVALSLSISNGSAQKINLEELSKKIANTSANIKPGDVVMVSGGVHTVPFMEDLAIEAQKSGGAPRLFRGVAEAHQRVYRFARN